MEKDRGDREGETHDKALALTSIELPSNFPSSSISCNVYRYSSGASSLFAFFASTLRSHPTLCATEE
jgi:hypothetical protein